MKTLISILGLAGIIFMTGCIPLSINAFYTDEDLIYDPALEGNWGVPEEGSTITIGPDGDLRYLLIDRAEGLDAHFHARLFEIDGTILLDLFPGDPQQEINPDWLVHMIPSHTLFKVAMEEDLLTLFPLNYDWVSEKLTDNPELLEHTESRDLLIMTAPSIDVRDFIADNLDDPDMFDEELVLQRLE